MLGHLVSGLGDQLFPIRQKQDTAHPVAAHQKVDESDGGSCFARAGGHDQQRPALPIALEGLRNPADGAVLVRSFNDRGVDRHVVERLLAGASLNQEL